MTNHRFPKCMTLSQHFFKKSIHISTIYVVHLYLTNCLINIANVILTAAWWWATSIVMYKYCDSQNTNILCICTLLVLVISLVIMLPSGKCYLPAQETIYGNGFIIVTEYSVAIGSLQHNVLVRFLFEER